MMYDILIVGAGTAGMACAITAAQNGARVAVIEKSDHIGGALHWSGGHMSAGGTKRQAAMGIEDSPEKHLEDIFRINNKSGDLALIEKAVLEAPRTIDWLEELGFEFAPECPRIIYGHVPYTRPRTHYGKEKALSIFKVLKPLWDQELANGKIDLYLEHRLMALKKEGDRFQQMIAEYQSQQLIFEGKSIVLCTGGYGSSPDFFQKKHPGIPLMSATYPTATGDGHQVIEQVGGQFQFAEHHLPSLGGVELAPNTGRCDFNQLWAMVLTSIYRQPREIYVNTHGKRFMNEDEADADRRERIVVQQPHWKFWLLFDEAALQERNPDGTENPIIIAWDTEKIKAAAAEGQLMVQAPSLEALAEKTQLPLSHLLNTVQEFNQMVDRQEDVEFGRTHLKNKISQAPFYAILVHASVLVTFGGMKVNTDLQLLDENDVVLPGLYAAGELLGLGATSGDAFCSGMAITPALSFGRILGKQLAPEKK